VDVSGLDPASLGGNSLQAVSFENDIVPIFSKSFTGGSCSSCHTGTVPLGGLNLNPQERTTQQLRDDIVNGRIDNANVANSTILARPAGSSHVQLFDATSDDYKKIKNWILAGAPVEDFVPPTPTPGGGSGMITPTPTVPPGANTVYGTQIFAQMNGCFGCHRPGGQGAVLDLQGGNSPNIANSCANVKAKVGVVNTGNPAASLLYTKPTGLAGHAGGAGWTTANQGAKVLAWIMNNAASCTQ